MTSSPASNRSNCSASCPKALDPEEEDEPITPSRKMKRNLMYERFRELIEGMYDDSEERLIAASAGDLAQ